MNLKMALLPPDIIESWEDEIRDAVPGGEVRTFKRPADVDDYIEEINCAYGFVPPELFRRAKNLKWIQCYAAGPANSFWFDELVQSDVIVTNFRGIFNEHVSAHAMSFLLAFSRNLHRYIPQQLRTEWTSVPFKVYLPESTALIIGAGGIGAETGRLCKAFGMKVVGIDPRVTEKPTYFDALYSPESLESMLPIADFVIITTPETPQTRRMINSKRLNLMKETSYLINVGRGTCVVLDDLTKALEAKKIAGAGLDVFEEEPLPPSSPLWSDPNVMITPHIAANQDSLHVPERRTRILLENCRRFSRGEELLNVMDKKNRF
jgi:phosphoglycerate dehydrogenase-like enzyme